MTTAFATTRWSQVAAIRGDASAARSALAWLCERYWLPLLAHAQRRGVSALEAEEVVQGFFARLVEKRDLAPDPTRGRFRVYLLGALEHYLSHVRDRARTLKRGGGIHHAPLPAAEPVHDESPERAFSRTWARALLARVLARLERERLEERSPGRFLALVGFLTGTAPAETYAQVGARVGLSEGAVKVAVHRLRRRYRELLYEEVAETLAHPEPSAVEAELRDLLDALS